MDLLSCTPMDLLDALRAPVLDALRSHLKAPVALHLMAAPALQDLGGQEVRWHWMTVGGPSRRWMEEPLRHRCGDLDVDGGEVDCAGQ
jgi:hypothetical protein